MFVCLCVLHVHVNMDVSVYMYWFVFVWMVFVWMVFARAFFLCSYAVGMHNRGCGCGCGCGVVMVVRIVIVRRILWVLEAAFGLTVVSFLFRAHTLCRFALIGRLCTDS